MHDHKHWIEVCEQAAVEKDPKKLLDISKEIYWLLAEKQHRLESGTLPIRFGIHSRQPEEHNALYPVLWVYQTPATRVHWMYGQLDAPMHEL